eukprot:TRINITY_DN10952_c0_g1_i1.p1 TRINITY_DN10952_c0_g1~~TRINITY_DN10952_c0_g1_i1.p1  ORF type:complete len:420 (+),score=63.93 TRINITY_DN10952_c0_g1_i1:69-1328(+)
MDTNTKEDVFMSPKVLSYPKNRIKVLCLENVAASGLTLFRDETFQVEIIPRALTIDELKEKITDIHLLCIRSATKITPEVLENANRLLAIGCFCIGTNQVDLDAAALKGIAVFNSPFCNTRSVAELIIAQIISLARRLGDKNMEMHKKIWDKSAKNCHEVRGKTLGIIGYGHIGTQLSILAEALGMHVVYKDIQPTMGYSNSIQVSTLDDLFAKSDFISCHVPETPETKHLITQNEFNRMKPGTYFLNASRGSVVVLTDLAEAIKSGHIAGAYVDVYEVEPEVSKKEGWECVLQGLNNVIMTPHVGGSTEEAQWAIGSDVARKMIDYVNLGISVGTVNFPNLTLQFYPETHRICSVHWNKPGALRDINNILGDFNVVSQVLGTQGPIGYLIIEIDRQASMQVKEAISALKCSIKTRIMY